MTDLCRTSAALVTYWTVSGGTTVWGTDCVTTAGNFPELCLTSPCNVKTTSFGHCRKFENCFSVHGRLYRARLIRNRFVSIGWLWPAGFSVEDPDCPLKLACTELHKVLAHCQALQQNAIYRFGLAVTCFPCFRPSLSGDFILSRICMNRDTRYPVVTFVYGKLTKPVILTLASL